MLERGVIYFGFDESNHSGENTQGEFVVCTYSTNHDDSVVRDWPNTRNYSFAEEWFKQVETGYRFTILSGEKYRFQSSSINLVEAAPFLISEMFTSPKRKIEIGPPEIIKLYFDGGGFRREQKEFLRGYFKDIGFKEVIVDNFIKKKGGKNKKFRKGPRCPRVVNIADLISNNLYHTPAGIILNHPCFIPFTA